MQSGVSKYYSDSDSLREGQRKLLSETLHRLAVTGELIYFVYNDAPIPRPADTQFCILETRFHGFPMEKWKSLPVQVSKPWQPKELPNVP